MRRFFYTVLLSLFFFSNLFVSCKEEKKVDDRLAESAFQRDLIIATPLIKNGDIITRTGADWTSLALCKLSQRDPTYSHCGIASIEHDSIFVYHALGGELHPNEALRRDPLATFIDVANNTGFGIFRFPLNTVQWQQVDSVIQYFYQRKTIFDTDFDLSTDDRLYCSEFVAKTFSRGLNQPAMFATYTLNGKKYVAVDNIFLQSTCRQIKRFRYF